MYTTQSDYLDLFIQKIQKINSSFSNSDTTSNDDYINSLLYTLGESSISFYFKFLNIFDENECKEYYRRYILSFCNHYIRENILSDTSLIGLDDFISGWKKFLYKLEKCDLKHCPQTMLLKNFYLEHKEPDSEMDNYTHKKSGFWKYYVCRKPASKSRVIPSIPEHKEIYKNEVPFYYILYTIYYYLTNDDVENKNEPFNTFKINLGQYRKYGSINNILEWCITCYKEWYDYYTLCPNKNTYTPNISFYISGIPHFLEHFGYFWHVGIEWNKNDLLTLFNNYDCESFTNEQFNSIDDLHTKFISSLLGSHRIATKPYISNKKIFNISDECLLDDNNGYIPRALEKLFLMLPNKLSKYFPDYNDASQDEQNKLFITVKIREFLSSIFLSLACAENDFLPYINMHLYFNFFLKYLKFYEIDENIEDMDIEIITNITLAHIDDDYVPPKNFSDLQELLNTTDNLENYISTLATELNASISTSEIINIAIVNKNCANFFELFDTIVEHYKKLDHSLIYKIISMPLFQTLQKHALLTANDIEKYIYQIYLESFINAE